MDRIPNRRSWRSFQARQDKENPVRVFDAVVCEAIAAGLCSEHFTVDGTLIESWAALKSIQPVAATTNPQPAD